MLYTMQCNSLSKSHCLLGSTWAQSNTVRSNKQYCKQTTNSEPFQCSNGHSSLQQHCSAALVVIGIFFKFSPSVVHISGIRRTCSHNFFTHLVVQLFPHWQYIQFTNHFQPCLNIAYLQLQLLISSWPHSYLGNSNLHMYLGFLAPSTSSHAHLQPATCN